MNNNLLLFSESGQEELVNSILQEAGLLADKGRPLTSSELHGIAKTVQDLDNGRSIVDRVKGMFNVINLIWILAICGIMAGIFTFPFMSLRSGSPLMLLLVFALLLTLIWYSDSTGSLPISRSSSQDSCKGFHRIRDSILGLHSAGLRGARLHHLLYVRGPRSKVTR